MNLTPAPICVDCGRDSGRDAATCGRCGGELVDVNLRQYFVAMGITASPMIVGPVAFPVGTYSEQQPTGWEGSIAVTVVGFICIGLSAYAAIGAAMVSIGGYQFHTAETPRRPARPQRSGVVNAVAASQRRRHQGQHLVASVGSSGRIPQVNVAVHQFTQAQVVGQGDRQQQPRIGHQAVIIKGNVDAVGLRR